MAKNDFTDKLREQIEIADKYEYIGQELKYYGLIKEDSVAWENKPMAFGHMDLELDDEVDYYDRVSLWFDFLTTVYKHFKVEPVLLIDDESIPTVAHLVKTLEENQIVFKGVIVVK